MSTEFVHLHLHTDYSMLDGACQIKKLAGQAVEMGMKSMAMTDHGNMCGALEFYEAMNAEGIKPIIGCEFYLAPKSRFEKNPNDPHHKGFHQLLLARDFDGYQNLCRLNAAAYLEGFYFKPRIDKELLARHSKGLIATSTCIGGEVPTYILAQNPSRARRALGEYLDIFGAQNFYLELQDHGMPKQREVNKALLEISREFELPVVATNDAHYLIKDHALPHELLLCIGTQKTMQDADRLRFPSQEFYVKSAAEMAALFQEVSGALRNTIEIAEKCNLQLELNAVSHYPVFEPPDGSDRRGYMLKQCKLGLIDRYGIDLDANGMAGFSDQQSSVVERMNYEVDVIDKMGFTSYFLVVWDFLDFARQRSIPIGPGRGSGAGSIVSYLLHITDIEPLHYNLLFERFLNPDRVSPPDFDIDLCERRRYEVIDYVRNKYGEDSVAQIGTFGTLKAKAVLKDVARVMGRSFEEGNRITKMIPNDPKMTLEKANAEIHEIRQLRNVEPWVNELFEHSAALEGLNRNMSIHAAGVIIGDQPLTNLVPLARGQGTEVITQYPAGPCEALGLLKLDFLGLRTLTIIQDTCDLIKKSQGRDLDPGTISMDDEATYDLLKKGETVAVFQLESSGMQDLCRRFEINRIEDIIALIALYRPGPIQFLDDFIKRKTGKTCVEYDVPVMAPILEETYGIMLYQEQVMQVCQQVAGFTLGQADILRRAMGKKKEEEMKAQYEKFVSGCAKNRIKKAVADSIWEKIVKFAGYGFNKSHSAAYAFLAYRTAYLKANYAVEFMAANLSSEMNSSERVALLINYCRDMDINVLPPDVNHGEMDFTVDGSTIRFGLAAIKGVGTAAAGAILEARKDGPFTSMLDLCERVGSSLNRRLLESLCQCGAFDGFGMKRSQMSAGIDDAIARTQASLRDRQVGQSNFFDLLDGEDQNNGFDLPAPDIPEWDRRLLLKYEKELLGFYVTGHPLNEYKAMIQAYELTGIRSTVDMPENQGVRVGGMITALTLKHAKRDGRPFAIINIEDLESSMECLVFPDAYAACAEHIVQDTPVLVEGFISKRDGEDQRKIFADRVRPLSQLPAYYTKEIHIRIYEENLAHDTLAQLKSILKQHPGRSKVIFCVGCAGGKFAFIEAGNAYDIQYSTDLEGDIVGLLGETAVRIKPDNSPAARERRPWEALNSA